MRIDAEGKMPARGELEAGPAGFGGRDAKIAASLPLMPAGVSNWHIIHPKVWSKKSAPTGRDRHLRPANTRPEDG